MKKFSFTNCLPLLCLFALTTNTQPTAAKQDSASGTAETKIVEEKSTIETRRVYETKTVRAKDPAPRKTAIFIENRAGANLNDKVQGFEDQVASLASGKEFSIISREDVLTAVKSYGVTAPRAAADLDRNALGTKLDQTLSDSSSALRLAQNLGADFILVATIGSYGKEAKNFNDPSIGVSARNIVYNLRGTYKVVEGINGASLGGGTFRSSKTIRQTENIQTESSDVINELLDDAAARVAEGLAAKAGQIGQAQTGGNVEIAIISCGVKDLAGNEISLPDLRVTEDNMVMKGDKELPVQCAATIEVDGFARGTTPAQIKVKPGPHKLRLSRPGFKEVELHINAIDGLTLSPTLQMTDAEFERWKNLREFLNHLDTSRKLTDARAEEIRGKAQMLRQSGYRISINTSNAPTIIKKNSIYSQDNY